MWKELTWSCPEKTIINSERLKELLRQKVILEEEMRILIKVIALFIA
ncbi:hypothetical protein [Listeria ivanovii]|nr:hypothetical protein [Listeria ivanovii]